MKKRQFPSGQAVQDSPFFPYCEAIYYCLGETACLWDISHLNAIQNWEEASLGAPYFMFVSILDLRMALICSENGTYNGGTSFV